MIKYFILIVMLLVPSYAQSAEITLINCQRSKTVMAKIESIETIGGNEYLHMVGQRTGSKATLIRTYNSKYENSKIVTDIDNSFHYYTYATCTFRFANQNKVNEGMFFVNKKESLSDRVRKIVGVVDLPGNMGGSISNTKAIILYEDPTVADTINKVCGIGNDCEIDYKSNTGGYIEQIVRIKRLK